MLNPAPSLPDRVSSRSQKQGKASFIARALSNLPKGKPSIAQWTFLFSVALAARLVIWAQADAPILTYDSKEYIVASQKLPSLVEFLRENKKGPTYPAFLFALHEIGLTSSGIVAVQVVMDAATHLLYTYILVELLGGPAAWLGFLLLFVDQSLITLSLSILSESLTSFLLAIHLLLLVRPVWAKGRSWPFIYVFTTVLLVMTRTSISFILVADVLILWDRKEYRWLPALPLLALMLFSLANYVVNDNFTPNRYMKYNFIRSARFCISQLKDDELRAHQVPALKVYMHELGKETTEVEKTPAELASQVLFGKLGLESNFPLLDIVEKSPRTFEQVVDDYFGIAVRAVVHHPLTYLKSSALGIALYLSGAFDIKNTLVDEVILVLLLGCVHIFVISRTTLDLLFRKRLNDPQVFIGLIICGNFVVSNLFDMGENQRYESLIFPLVVAYVLVAFARGFREIND
jgi:hypothetical protein